MTKKIVSLTIDSKPVNCDALVAIVGGRNAGKTNAQAWFDLSMSGVVDAFKPTDVVCVLKDEKPFRQMTIANISKGLEFAPALREAVKTLSDIGDKLAALQVHYVSIPAVLDTRPDTIRKQLQAFMDKPASGQASKK